MSKNEKPVRVWVDGCFDVVHFGHANALRQAKQFGDVLVVGVHSDEEILKNKGPTVFTEQERYFLVKSIKWVDEVVEGSAYVTQLEDLNTHGCDFCLHGDDVTLSSDGIDSYHYVKNAGRYKEFKRTEGISTTDLVGRMLLMTRHHHSTCPETSSIDSSEKAKSKYTGLSPYQANTLSIMQFCDQIFEPAPDQKVLYLPGSFDMFHVGHAMFLEKASKLGDYIIIGLYSDQVVNQMDGLNYPIMNVNERLLTVLANRHVKNVLIGAPLDVNETLISQFKIDLVVVGKENAVAPGEHDPFAFPKQKNIFKVVDSGSDLTTSKVLERIIQNRRKYEERNKSKQRREIDFLENQ